MSRATFHEITEDHALVCNEIRGGNRRFIGTRKLPGMAAWVATLPINQENPGGDLHFLSACDRDLICRVALADVSGHGADVDEATRVLHKLMLSKMNIGDQAKFMQGLNDTFSRLGDGEYATAIVLSVNRITGGLDFSNAGHPPPLWYHASEKTWGWLAEDDATPRKAFGLPVGLFLGTEYSETIVTLGRSDLLVLYTDGIIDAEDKTGKSLGREQLMEWARGGPVESAPRLGQHLLARLAEFRGRTQSDDETLLVLQRE